MEWRVGGLPGPGREGQRFGGRTERRCEAPVGHPQSTELCLARGVGGNLQGSPRVFWIAGTARKSRHPSPNIEPDPEKA